MRFSIAFRKPGFADERSGLPLWLAPVGGGQPRKPRSISEAVERIAVHPNGRDVAFATRDHSGGKFWVIENAFTKRGS